MSKRKIVITEVIELLNSGYTRLEKDNVENIGSLETFYDLNPAERKMLFNHPKVKGIRKATPVNIEIVDEDDSTEDIPYVEDANTGIMRGENSNAVQTVTSDF